MLKNYKDAEIKYLGDSDIARLVLRSPAGVEELYFGEDGSYQAYVIDDSFEVPEHYQLTFTANFWLKIYDDRSLVADFHGEKIEVYRAGDYGCLIKIEN